MLSSLPLLDPSPGFALVSVFTLLNDVYPQRQGPTVTQLQSCFPWVRRRGLKTASGRFIEKHLSSSYTRDVAPKKKPGTEHKCKAACCAWFPWTALLHNCRRVEICTRLTPGVPSFLSGDGSIYPYVAPADSIIGPANACTDTLSRTHHTTIESHSTLSLPIHIPPRPQASDRCIQLEKSIAAICSITIADKGPCSSLPYERRAQ